MTDFCAKKGHDFQRFDDRQVFCSRCGEFRMAPSVPYTVPVAPWYPMWWQPYVYPTVIYSGTSTIIDVTTGYVATLDSGQSTYTVMS